MQATLKQLQSTATSMFFRFFEHMRNIHHGTEAGGFFPT